MHTLDQLRSGALMGCTRLDLCAGLTELPAEVFELADTLEVLNLSGNALSNLPHELPRLHRLKVLFCSGNRFTRVPEVVGACSSLRMVGFKSNQLTALPADALPPQLRWLILTDNQLTGLPAALGDCTGLEKLALAGNRLSALPERMAACQQLGLVRISANQFERLPPWLLALPRLAWLAAGGNPWNAEREAAVLSGNQSAHVLPSVEWAALELGEVLGQGASGVIQAALHRGAGPGCDDRPPQPLAVKLFKGEVTSDGWPHSEWAASLAVAQHAHLISAQGRLVGHPQGVQGLVMPRIGAEFQCMAAPPSLDSCTRDVYAPQQRFTPEQVLRMARGVADAAAHLHAHGVSHGDLYAHNILWNPHGQVWLGDFGAATLLPQGLDAAARRAIEAVEVRAFGLLLEEWLERCADAPPLVRQIAQGCVNPEVGERPRFREIQSALGSAPRH
jgi:hypothetical protein